MKQRKTLSGWLSNRYLLTIRNEEDFAEKSTYNFTYAKLIVLILLLTITIFSLALYSFNTVLAKWLDPRYEQQENRKMLISLSTKVDSLNYRLEQKDVFIQSFRTMLEGGLAMDADGVSKEKVINPEDVDIDFKAPVDSLLREEFEDIDYNLTFSNRKEEELVNMFLFKPIEGVITQEYEPKKDHFAIDVVAKTDEPVKSIAPGTVIMSSWTEDSGNVIAVQHKNNLTSIYKHNAVVLKKIGSFVEAGEIIAIVGNSGEWTSGPHLHFEMWHNGNPINPLNYINY